MYSNKVCTIIIHKLNLYIPRNITYYTHIIYIEIFSQKLREINETLAESQSATNIQQACQVANEIGTSQFTF